jgi:pyruvate/2-oxoglutarate dehydrogenase complex dihydrolipoamide dehydrogenase (E3) component
VPYDHNLVVIGGGAAGLVSSYIAAAVKAKVTLVENQRMGGDCLYTGCVPSKTLLRTAHLLHDIKHATQYGIGQAEATIDFAEVMQRIRTTITQIEPHDSVARYRALGVHCVLGQASLLSPHLVKVVQGEHSQLLSTANIIIATGAHPSVPSIPGLAQIAYLTSDTLWNLRELPKRLLVLGAGPIGCEMAQAFARLGSEVQLVEMATQILPREDACVAEVLHQALLADGITVHLGSKVTQFSQHSAQLHTGQQLAFDQVLIALGRSPNTAGLGLEALGIQLDAKHTISHNGLMQTAQKNIYVCGDVAGPYQFTHVAAHQAWYASVNALFRPFKQFTADYRVIPAATFTSPEVARVGLNEQEAKAQNIAYEISHYALDDLDRAIADGDNHGFVRVLSRPNKDQILGVTIVGKHAAEMLPEFVLAMKHGIGLNKILGTIHAYPTWSEANKYAAGIWKKAHAPEWALRLLDCYHDLRRRG